MDIEHAFGTLSGPDGASWLDGGDLSIVGFRRDDSVPKLTPRTEPCPNCGSNKVTWYFRSVHDAPDSPGGVSCSKCGHEDMKLS